MVLPQAAADRYHVPGWLPMATGLLPFAIVHLCYFTSVNAGLVPGCLPYLSGCTSISAAGRYGTAWYLFKAGMLPAAALLAAYWVATRRWLLAIGVTDTRPVRAMVVLGVVAAMFLVLYTIFLGSKGDFYDLMRRYGVTVYFSFSALAQMLLVRELMGPQARALTVVPGWIVRAKFALIGALLATGLLSIPIGNFAADKDRAENAIEWIFAAMMSGFYLLSWPAWRATRPGVMPEARRP